MDEPLLPNAHLPPYLPPLTLNGAIKATQLITINVGGRRAKLPTDLLCSRVEGGRLGVFCRKSHVERLTECDAFFETSDEYYFERSPAIFEYIVDFYITGKLHRPLDVCPFRLRYELDFWRIPVHLLAGCCVIEDASGREAKRAREAMMSEQHSSSMFEKVMWGKQRLMIYRFLESPRSSLAAKVFSISSALFVLLSLAGLIMSSIPELQDEHKEPVRGLIILEYCCMIWFTLEYMARFLVNPKKWDFVSSTLNIIDLFTILPFIIEEFLPLKWMKEIRGAMLVIRVMRLARVARIFKLARYSTGLRAFGQTMKKSAAELSMLGMFLVTGIMLFSTAIYFFERDEPNSKFYSIPAACWWCVITMTTVGYGDLVPVTTGGKVVAAVASVCGIIVLAFPISMIIDKFAESTGHWGTDDEEPTAQPSGNRRQKSKRYVF
ncbi:unnamed protein product, partial [Mesorhabditis belari]|uniref:BTB domain-containing protein n=1 Tax=Mesorhabditis belari TaxID=2138241 RepID=A0AAF3FFX9_9BILA